MELCLASHSPRRRQLLESLGVQFFVQSAAAEVEEAVLGKGRGTEAHLVAGGRASAKGRAVLDELRKERDCSQLVILAADTVVHLGDEILDKPKDKAEAIEFLNRLSGTKHGVITALSVFAGESELTRWRRTWVEFRKLSEITKEAYVATGEPFDKAGGYGIQGVGGALVERIDGCFFNVMGLPLQDVGELLDEIGVNWSLNPSQNA